ncbi:unnamed protein product [Prorocentrum cordatum]|uniref:Uncharacterized protein n=1 Tax=Prorocentrum cordatum TaxID=2364126 RepID=A0ABN9PRT4_9DINO|nr:unnamed protein product [Polarella glacialis]
MQLPASSHREYYRKRVSPRKNSDTAHINLAERPICTKGSRWHGYALTRDDIGSSIFISGGKVLIGNVARTDIDAGYANNGLSAPMTCTDVPTPQMVSENEACSAHGACKYDNDWVASKYCQQSCFDAGNGYDGDDCSGGWPSRNGWGGFVCLVQEEVGGMVVLGTQSDCSPWGVRIYLYNPAIWFADASVAVPTTLPFDQASWRPGLIFLREDAQNCNLDSKGFILKDGLFYRHETRLALEDHTCQLQPEDGALDFGIDGHLCGSPGEVSNAGTGGHQFPIRASGWLAPPVGSPPDYVYDNRYGTHMFKWPPLTTGLARGAVWLNLALHATDQLRQRVAWALSQIFVIGSSLGGHDYFTEMWTNYYDIFVRHAFGNYRDVLREVTFAPLMGEYLTYAGSFAFDDSLSYADENYAREVMQLFTIGVAKVVKDGRVVVNDKGEDVPTYTNENIINFARVFTGFVRWNDMRMNIELATEGSTANYIDPMKIRGRPHDIYPKPDLYSGYLGDGYPVCSSMPERPFCSLEPGSNSAASQRRIARNSTSITTRGIWPASSQARRRIRMPASSAASP